MVLEYKGTINKLQKEIIEGLTTLFIVWKNYTEFTNTSNLPSFTNKKGAEALLQFFFKQSDDSIFSYLKTLKNAFYAKVLDNRAHRNTHNSDTSRTAK